MSAALKRTPLHGEHLRLGGKMVPFAGYEMPVQYRSGILAEHAAVRSCAGLFDASHMGEFLIHGPEALEFVQHLCINDASRLAVGDAQYSAMCRDSGGVVDDLLVYRFPDRFMLVVNASNLEKDSTWILRHALEFEVRVDDVSAATSLLALQGPAARDILKRVTPLDVDGVGYYRFIEGEVAGIPAVVSMTGYTGEDGAELYVGAQDAAELWRALLDAGEGHGLVPAGLGARDSLRIEMGYPLYGNDLDEEHTPFESGIGWIAKVDKGPFLGRDVLAAQRDAGVAQKLVGLRLTERGFPRQGYPIVSEGQVVGVVTSGVLSPSLGVGIAMGRVPTDLSRIGTDLHVDVRGRLLEAVVESPPFYPDGSIRRR